MRGWGAIGGLALALVGALAVSLAGADVTSQGERGNATPWALQRERERPVDAASLLRLFAASTGFEAEYAEEKRLVLLAAPLESRGRMYFLPPGHLLRRVLQPEASSVAISPTRMRLEQRGQERVIDFATAPEIGAFARALALVFAGKADELGTHWIARYAPVEGTPRAWRFELTPREDAPNGEALARIVERITIEGEGEAVLSIEVLEASGDVTRTRILACDPARVFTAEERRQLFGPSAPGAATVAARTGES